MDCFIDSARTPSQRRLAACIERWRQTGDRRALFAAGHLMAIDTVMATARAGRFSESAWVLRLLECWSEYYLITVEAFEDDLTLVTPPAWIAAHAAAAVSETAPLDAVMLGVSAHFNNDLPQAVADMLREEWPVTSTLLERRHTDVLTMLHAMADALDSTQCLLARFDANLARSGPHAWIVRSADTRVESLIQDWASFIWSDALSLVTAADARWAGAIRESIECTAVRRAHALVCSVPDAERLLRLPGSELDGRFPHRHDPRGCMLGVRAPAWGQIAAGAH